METKFYEVFWIRKGSIRGGFKWNNRPAAVQHASSNSCYPHWVVVEYDQDTADKWISNPVIIAKSADELGVTPIAVNNSFNSLRAYRSLPEIDLVFDESTTRWFNDV